MIDINASMGGDGVVLLLAVRLLFALLCVVCAKASDRQTSLSTNFLSQCFAATRSGNRPSACTKFGKPA